MKNVFEAMIGALLLCLSLGCSEAHPRAGCTVTEIRGNQCVNSPQCPACSLVCEEVGGTAVSAPHCAQFVGFGFFCTCTCEICFDPDGGVDGGDGGSSGNDGSGSGGDPL